MAARRFSCEEVLEQIFSNEDSLSEEEEPEVRTDILADTLEEWINSFDGGDHFDSQFFRENAKQVLLPIARQSSINYTERQDTIEMNARRKAAHRLCTRTLSAGSILANESRLWLDAIFKRLSGKVSIRRPYYAETTRTIPYDVFVTSRQVLGDFGEKEPECYIASNRKGEVISITSLDLLQKFFSCLSAINIREVKKYFTRKLTSRSRNNHRVKVIVSEEKDFGFVYKKNSGQLIIQFHYGEWNSHGFPQHRCGNKLLL